jgi:hypothetical protein
MTSAWRHEQINTTADDLSDGRLSRSNGWLRLQPAYRAHLWIKPETLELVWFVEGDGLSTYQHASEQDFIKHFTEVAIAYAQAANDFPMMLETESDPAMLRRLEDLGLTQILKERKNDGDKPDEPEDGEIGSGNA